MTLRLLDLYCGVGGSAVGYARTGFEVVGVDIAPQPDYPYEFHADDAITYAKAHGHEFDVIHASPPCQSSTALTKGTNRGRRYPQLIPDTRQVLDGIGVPYVIENVAGAPIRHDVMLCGELFGLAVIRHRFFELGEWGCEPALHIAHRGRVAGMRHGEWFDGPYFAVYGCGGGKGSVAQWRTAMGIDWTDNRVSLAEAVPPAYTEWIGVRWREVLA